MSSPSNERPVVLLSDHDLGRKIAQVLKVDEYTDVERVTNRRSDYKIGKQMFINHTLMKQSLYFILFII